MQKLATGFLVGFMIIGTVLGSLMLSLQQSLGRPIDIPIPTITLEIASLATPVPTLTSAALATPTPGSSPTPTMTPSLMATVCPIPLAWQRYVVGAFDTLPLIARRFNTTVDQLAQANCLQQPIVSKGQTIFVPSIGPPPTIAVCYPPLGWVPIIVRPGDTLSVIAQRYGLSVYYLMRANCLTSSFIYAGQKLYVPYAFVPQVTPATPTLLPTDTPTILPTTTVPTMEASPTPTPIGPTDTPIPTFTAQPTPTDTPVATVTPPVETPIPLLPTDTLESPTLEPPTQEPPSATPALPAENTPISPAAS